MTSEECSLLLSFLSSSSITRGSVSLALYQMLSHPRLANQTRQLFEVFGSPIGHTFILALFTYNTSPSFSLLSGTFAELFLPLFTEVDNPIFHLNLGFLCSAASPRSVEELYRVFSLENPPKDTVFVMLWKASYLFDMLGNSSYSAYHKYVLYVQKFLDYHILAFRNVVLNPTSPIDPLVVSLSIKAFKSLATFFIKVQLKISSSLYLEFMVLVIDFCIHLPFLSYTSETAYSTIETVELYQQLFAQSSVCACDFLKEFWRPSLAFAFALLIYLSEDQMNLDFLKDLIFCLLRSHSLIAIPVLRLFFSNISVSNKFLSFYFDFCVLSDSFSIQSDVELEIPNDSTAEIQEILDPSSYFRCKVQLCLFSPDSINPRDFELIVDKSIPSDFFHMNYSFPHFTLEHFLYAVYLCLKRQDCYDFFFQANFLDDILEDLIPVTFTFSVPQKPELMSLVILVVSQYYSINPLFEFSSQCFSKFFEYVSSIHVDSVTALLDLFIQFFIHHPEERLFEPNVHMIIKVAPPNIERFFDFIKSRNLEIITTSHRHAKPNSPEPTHFSIPWLYHNSFEMFTFSKTQFISKKESSIKQSQIIVTVESDT